MGNLKQKYTTEEWDEMVDSTKPGFVEKRIKQAIQEAAELNAKKVGSYAGYQDFIAGAEWMMENIKINLRHSK